MSMPGRKFSSASSNYRYGFNGKEDDKDINSGAIAFEARIYDSRIGRFFSTDPRQIEYPWQTPYAYFKNCPISILDIKGEGGTGEDPPMNVPKRHKWSAKSFFGKQGGNSIYTSLEGGDLATMYKNGIANLKSRGLTQGDVVFSNGQTWNLNIKNGHFNPVSGKGILNLSALEMGQLENFQANIKKGLSGEEALANMVKGMEKSGNFSSGSLKGDFLEAVNKLSGENGVSENSIIKNVSKFLPEATVDKGLSEAATQRFGQAKRFVKWGGRVLIVVAVAADLVEIYNSENKPRTIIKTGGRWAGAWAGGAGAASAYAATGADLTGPWGWGGHVLVTVGGAIGGAWVGEKITETVYDWIFTKKN
jgi:RHS repeat-associated protein